MEQLRAASLRLNPDANKAHYIEHDAFSSAGALCKLAQTQKH
jgi:hypothetical protein